MRAFIIYRNAPISDNVTFYVLKKTRFPDFPLRIFAYINAVVFISRHTQDYTWNYFPWTNVILSIILTEIKYFKPLKPKKQDFIVLNEGNEGKFVSNLNKFLFFILT